LYQIALNSRHQINGERGIEKSPEPKITISNKNLSQKRKIGTQKMLWLLNSKNNPSEKPLSDVKELKNYQKKHTNKS